MGDCTEWISAAGALIGGLGGAAAGAAAVYVAFRASKTGWLEGEDRKLAIEALAHFREGRFHLDAIRNPGQSGAEVAEAEKQLKEGGFPAPKFRQVSAAITLARLQYDTEFWRSYQKLLMRVGAVFGDAAADEMRQIVLVRGEVWSATKVLLHEEVSSTTITELEIKIFRDSELVDGEVHDEINARLDNAYRRLETALRKHVKP